MKDKSFMRTVAKVINLFVMINTLGLVIIGIYHTVSSFIKLFRELFEPGVQTRPVLAMLESIDVFLISLVFLVFSVGINILFINPDNQELLERTPKWMRVKDFSELKFLLMEAIIATLFVLLISEYIQAGGAVGWEFLVLPITIILLSIGLKALKWKEGRKE